MRISGQGTFNPYFQNTNIIFKKDPTFAFDILEFVILTFAQFFSPISENTSPSLRFLVLHFQQSHISYCRQKSKICSNKEIHQSLIFTITRTNMFNGIFRWVPVWKIWIYSVDGLMFEIIWIYSVDIIIWSVSQEGRNNGILIRVKSLSRRDFLRRLTTHPRDSPSPKTFSFKYQIHSIRHNLHPLCCQR